MSKEDEGVAKSFPELASLGKEHFSRIFKAPPEVSIVEVVRVAQLFLRYVDVEEN